DRRRRDRARPVPDCLPRLRHDDALAAQPLRVRPRLVRARAHRSHGGRDQGDEARARRRDGHRRAGGVDARAARQALLQPRPLPGRRARVPARGRDLPQLRLRARRAGDGRSGTRPAGERDRVRPPRSRPDPAAAVRRDPRRPLPRHRPPRARRSAVRTDRRDRAPAARERRPRRPRDRAVRRRPRPPPAACARPRSHRPARATVDRRGRRAGVGARAERPVRARTALLATRAPARHAGRRQVLPPRDDRALPRPTDRRPYVVPARARAQPALLAAVGAARPEVRGVKRLLLALAVLVVLAAPVAATAHPLGNFTINRYTELDLQGDRLFAVYVLDLAEIPTFQARESGGVNGASAARRIAAHLHLTIDGRAAVLRPVRHELAFPPGQGGLDTTRLEILLAGPKLRGDAAV